MCSFSRLFMNFFNNSKGILVDLPETNLFASYYLSVNFPKKRIKFFSDLPEDFEIDHKFFDDCDLVILPPFAVKKISNDLIDLVVNTASLGEMSVEYGEFYLEEINRITKKYFYTQIEKILLIVFGVVMEIININLNIIGKPYYTKIHLHGIWNI